MIGCLAKVFPLAMLLGSVNVSATALILGAEAAFAQSDLVVIASVTKIEDVRIKGYFPVSELELVDGALICELKGALQRGTDNTGFHFFSSSYSPGKMRLREGDLALLFLREGPVPYMFSADSFGSFFDSSNAPKAWLGDLLEKLGVCEDELRRFVTNQRANVD